MNNESLKTITQDISKLDQLTSLPLPAFGSWPESVHQFDEDSINALKAALAAQRPLLLRGDPGTGKSQLARAAAIALKRLFVYEVVNAHTESQDLLFRFDAVARLAEAQSMQGSGCTPEQRSEALESQRFISPGPLWWSLSYKSANEVYEKSQYQLSSPEKPDNWQQQQGSVLLIDEIDKANVELPNGLLEMLGNNAVNLPWLKTTLGGNNSLPPLVLITTNEERELPAAFVRRCLVLNLELPSDDDAFKALMVERGGLHYGDYCSETIRQLAAEQLLADRKYAREKGVANLPGQAEYLDILRALAVLGNNENQQQAMLAKIAKFALCKYPLMYGR
ncbi:MAG: MoxR family ATPase [Gammaproteobacteria bacterium]|nr:MoxR family ATPase [Gammaproteobacteria bacterium]